MVCPELFRSINCKGNFSEEKFSDNPSDFDIGLFIIIELSLADKSKLCVDKTVLNEQILDTVEQNE